MSEQKLTTDQKAGLIADALLGTCDSLEHALSRYDWDGLDNDLEFCQALDDRVLCCVQCSWWSETHEFDDEGVCEDCQ